jgi:hypothetical protein
MPTEYTRGKREKSTFMLEAELFRCRDEFWCSGVSNRAKFLSGTYIGKQTRHKLQIGLAPSKKNLAVYGLAEVADSHGNLEADHYSGRKPYLSYSIHKPGGSKFNYYFHFNLSDKATRVEGLQMCKGWHGPDGKWKYQCQNYSKLL